MRNNSVKLIPVLVGLALTNGCFQNGSNSGTTNTSGKNTAKIYEWKQIKSMATNFKPTGDKINHVASSKNTKWLYATADDGRELFAADLNAQFSDISDDAKWAKIGLVNTGLDGTAGQATLADTTIAQGLVPTEKGVLVERYAGGKSDDNGVGYLAGATWTAAWSHEGNAAQKHLAHTNLSQNQGPISAGLITKAGVEYPVLFSEYENSRNVAGSTSALGKVKMGTLITGDGPVSFAGLSPKLVMAGKDVLIVDRSGVNTLEDSVINPADAAWMTKNPKTTDNTPYLGSSSWMIKSPNPNNKVTSVAVSGTKLFIGLGVTPGEPGQGGVAVYDFVTPANSKAPDAAWEDTGVLALTVDPAGKVWAVTKTKLILANADGTMGDKMTTKPLPADASVVANQDYDKTPLLPTDNISDACFVGENLVISTTDQGIIYRLAPVTKTVSP